MFVASATNESSGAIHRCCLCDLKSSRNGSIVADATRISFRAFYPALKDRAKLRLPLRGRNLSHAFGSPLFLFPFSLQLKGGPIKRGAPALLFPHLDFGYPQ